MVNLINAFLWDHSAYCTTKTINTYRENLEKFRRWLGDGCLNENTYREYICYLNGTGISSVSVRSYAVTVKVFLNWAYSKRMIDYVDVQVKLPRPKPKLIQVLSIRDVSDIDRCLSERDFLIVHLMLDCGLRSGEVLALTKKQIPMTSSFIKIQVTKSKKSRVVPVPPQLLQRLHKYVANLDPDKKVFQLSESGLKTRLQRLKKESGVEHLHAHLFRHTFATSYLFYRYGDLVRLQLLLGHEDLSTTAVYLHLASSFSLLKTKGDQMIYRIHECFMEDCYE